MKSSGVAESGEAARAAPQDPSAAITRSAGTVVVGTLGSRVLGALRDAVIAASFSVAATDAFIVAWTIPNALRRLLGEGAVSAAFVPVFIELDQQHGRERARQFTGRFAGGLLAALAVASVLGVLCAPLLATFYAAGYQADPAKFATTSALTAVVFPYVLFAGWAALLTGALNAAGSFFLPALSPALLNVALIAAPLTCVPLAVALGLQPLIGLGVASLVGGALQVAVQIPAARKLGVWKMPELSLRDPEVVRSLRLMAPLLLGTGVYQANILLSRLLASFMPDGSQSSLYYAQRLVEIPQGMFAVAVASAALPSLTRLQTQGESGAALEAMRHSVRLTSFVALPCSAALIVLAEPTVAVIFGRGRFGVEQITDTAHALTWLAAGVLPIAAVQPITRMYYAYGDTRTPVIASVLNLLVFCGVSVALAGALQHGAIAFGSSVAGCAQVALLLVSLRAHARERGLSSLGLVSLVPAVLRHLVASAALAAAAYAVAHGGNWARGGNDLGNIARYAAALTAGGLAYALASYVLRAPELSQALQAVRARRAKRAPSP
jgi:putative peptidoglycan lipid II flippase